MLFRLLIFSPSHFSLEPSVLCVAPFVLFCLVIPFALGTSSYGCAPAYPSLAPEASAWYIPYSLFNHLPPLRDSFQPGQGSGRRTGTSLWWSNFAPRSGESAFKFQSFFFCRTAVLATAWTGFLRTAPHRVCGTLVSDSRILKNISSLSPILNLRMEAQSTHIFPFSIHGIGGCHLPTIRIRCFFGQLICVFFFSFTSNTIAVSSS